MKNSISSHPIFLKKGYTTGSCACAAAVSALESLLTKSDVTNVQITLPNGEDHSFDCKIKEHQPNFVISSIRKDAGDDKDITNNIEILAKVELIERPDIEIFAGKGIGICTKEGLAVKVGDPAINPIAKNNIIENLKKIFGKRIDNSGVKVTLSIPEGELLAKKTLNEKLGILGGLSILGTTGIVKPMSNEAIIQTIYYELNQIFLNSNDKSVVLVPGNYGKTFAEDLNINPTKIVQVSNFIGDSLDIAKELGFKKILLIGDIGKLVKVAGGIFQTHSKVADARQEILAANLASLKAPYPIIHEVLNANTTREIVEIINTNHLNKIYSILVDKIRKRINERIGLNIEVVLFSNGTGLLAKTESCNQLIRSLN